MPPSSIYSCLTEWSQQHQALIFSFYFGKFDLARNLDGQLEEAYIDGFDRRVDPISPRLASMTFPKLSFYRLWPPTTSKWSLLLLHEIIISVHSMNEIIALMTGKRPQRFFWNGVPEGRNMWLLVFFFATSGSTNFFGFLHGTQLQPLWQVPPTMIVSWNPTSEGSDLSCWSAVLFGPCSSPWNRGICFFFYQILDIQPLEFKQRTCIEVYACLWVNIVYIN